MLSDGCRSLRLRTEAIVLILVLVEMLSDPSVEVTFTDNVKVLILVLVEMLSDSVREYPLLPCPCKS